MDLAYSPEEEAFRARLREWLAKTLPSLPPKPSPDDWPGRRSYDLGWQRTLYDAGYGEVHWDASPTTRLIFLEETERAGAPYVGAGFVGLLHAGPTIAAEGTAEQRARWLPPILRGEEVWCQGFSEPDAGSDLASLRTRARRDGDTYVVNGSKIWTSHAEVADWCELLVRTDGEAPKHRGISWLAMPMDAPGVTVRPLRTLAGSTEFAEVFLDDVRVPVANRVGAENDGWRVTMVTLSFERGTAFVGEVVACRRVLAEVAREAQVPEAFGDWTALVEHPDVDAVAIAVPPGRQPEIAIRALALGKPVFAEKPMAADLAGAAAMLRQAGAIPTMIDFSFTELPAWRAAKSLLDRDAIGRLRHVAVSWNVENAWIRKVEGPTFKANANDVAMQSVEIIHEGIFLEG